MYQLPRRRLLQCLIGLPVTLAGKRFWPSEQLGSSIPPGYLNVHLRGPFSFVFFAKKNQVLVISPDPLNHHLPSFSSVNSEAPIQKADYVLVGANPTSAARPTWTDPNVNRLSIDAKTLKMDSGGVIDQGQQRFFSIWMPVPDFIAPWHAVNIVVTGSQSPFGSAAVPLPVGYTFIYQNTQFSQVQIKCPKQSNYDWPAGLLPYPGQNAADILIEMASSLDIDCKHKGAMEAFADECGLFAGVNPGVQLDVGLNYGPPDPNCKKLAEALKHRKRHQVIPRIGERSTAHTGTDCKAPLLEIVNASDNVTLGP